MSLTYTEALALASFFGGVYLICQVLGLRWHIANVRRINRKLRKELRG